MNGWFDQQVLFAFDGARWGLVPAAWAVFAAAAAVLGACVGSFLNVCIYRIPLDQSVVRPRSHCMSCGALIPWYHNLPVVSYFVLRGRCARCGARFSFRYAAVEALVALLFVAVFCAFPPAGASAPLGIVPVSLGGAEGAGPSLRPLGAIPVRWLFVSGLVIGTFVDFDHYFLPDSVTIGGMAAGLVCSLLVPEIQPLLVFVHAAPDGPVTAIRFAEAHSRWAALALSAAGLAAGFGGLQAVRAAGTRFFRRIGHIGPEEEAMGFGDVKLLGAIGAFFGPLGALVTVVLGAVAGVLVAVPLLLAGRRTLLSRIPFGPYLSLGALLWLLWGRRLVLAYLLFAPPWRVAL